MQLLLLFNLSYWCTSVAWV